MRCRRLPVKFTEQSQDPRYPGFLEDFQLILERRNLDSSLASLVFNISLAVDQSFTNEPITISISGSQGSGKSTLAKLLAEVLQREFSRTSAIISIDDFYLTRTERQLLAKEVHPLLAVRGVPGTHDIGLLKDVLRRLQSGAPAHIPSFSKADDDRVVSDPPETGPVDIIICEGWCWGAIPEPETRLAQPVNDLERERDANGRWRHYVNQQLSEYQSVFKSDGSVFLKAPSMDAVFRWRWQQEQALLKERGGAAVMTESGVRGFIAYYERLTRWMLESLPDNVDLLAELDEAHRIAAIHYT
jgi:D-glycerate 3-kinase